MKIAVVGAGPAGAGAAHALSEHDVTVFEADEVGGRARTRHRAGCHYDVGANYVKPGGGRVDDLVRTIGDGPVDIAEPVWTFDAGGDIAPGRDADAHKWTWPSGIAELPRRLIDSAGVTLREERVTTLSRTNRGWRVGGDEGPASRFDAVVLTPPGSETATLVAEADWDAPLRETIVEAANAVPYRSIVSALLHYDYARDYPFYALVNTDGAHAVGWLSREECKPGHVPDGESLLVVQMAPDWSTEHADADVDAVTAAAADHAAALLDDGRRRTPDWTETAFFERALPDDGIEAGVVERAAEAGLGLAGDWVAGEGRIHRAVESGIAAGERLAGGGRE
jgi:renalase